MFMITVAGDWWLMAAAVVAAAAALVVVAAVVAVVARRRSGVVESRWTLAYPPLTHRTFPTLFPAVTSGQVRQAGEDSARKAWWKGGQALGCQVRCGRGCGGGVCAHETR